jgi:SAM-dependent methyltransferase
MDDRVRKPSVATDADLESVARQRADLAVAGADLDSLGRLTDELDRVALLTMAHTLRRVGLFASDGAEHDLDQIYRAIAVVPRHRTIVRRWLRALCRNDMLTERDQVYNGLIPVSVAEVDNALAGLDVIAGGLEQGPGMAGFFRSSASYLPELLRDVVSLQALLFTDGDMDVAHDVYQRNLSSRYTNEVAAAVIAELAATTSPLRVVEVGAGVGGTTAAVLKAMEGRQVDYLFTDVTRFFLTSARDRFGHLPWLRRGLLDINRDFADQGYRPGSADVVLAANVLHNAHHTTGVLSRIRDLVGPGGWVVFVEGCVEHYQLMTSMQFLMSPSAQDADRDFADFRHGTDRIFPSREEWLGVLCEAGFRPRLCLPEPEHPLSRIGQHTFVGRVPHP